MTENTNTTEQTPNVKPAKARKTNDGPFTIGQLAVQRAKAQGHGDTSRAAKEIRGKLRANFTTVVKLQPNVSKAKSSANDGNRWPSISARVRDELKLVKSGK